jgi:hypothetical protein
MGWGNPQRCAEVTSLKVSWRVNCCAHFPASTINSFVSQSRKIRQIPPPPRRFEQFLYSRVRCRALMPCQGSVHSENSVTCMFRSPTITQGKFCLYMQMPSMWTFTKKQPRIYSTLACSPPYPPAIKWILLQPPAGATSNSHTAAASCNTSPAPAPTTIRIPPEPPPKTPQSLLDTPCLSPPLIARCGTLSGTA